MTPREFSNLFFPVGFVVVEGILYDLIDEYSIICFCLLHSPMRGKCIFFPVDFVVPEKVFDVPSIGYSHFADSKVLSAISS